MFVRIDHTQVEIYVDDSGLIVFGLSSSIHDPEKFCSVIANSWENDRLIPFLQQAGADFLNGTFTEKTPIPVSNTEPPVHPDPEPGR